MPTPRGRKNGYSLGGGVFTLKSSKKAFKKVKMDDSGFEIVHILNQEEKVA